MQVSGSAIARRWKERQLQREILKVRDRGIERLLASMPYQAGDDLAELRRWTETLARDASRFEIAKAQLNALARGGRNG